MNDYARKTGLLKEKIKTLKGQTIVRDLAAVLSILVPEEHLQFEGQTKDKLGSPTWLVLLWMELWLIS